MIIFDQIRGFGKIFTRHDFEVVSPVGFRQPKGVIGSFALLGSTLAALFCHVSTTKPVVPLARLDSRLVLYTPAAVPKT
jgi:hypothetical protein